MTLRQAARDIMGVTIGLGFAVFVATPYIFSDQLDKIVDKVTYLGIPKQTITLNEDYVPRSNVLEAISQEYIPKKVKPSQHVNVQDLNGDGANDYVIISYDENTPLGRVDAFRSRVDKKTGEVVYELTR